MNLVSIAVGFYMLVMGVILLVSSTFYRLELEEMERGQGILCTRSLYYTKVHRSEEVDVQEEEKVPLCRNMKYWKLYSEIGIVSGSTYIIFLLSFIVVSCCCSKGSKIMDDDDVIEEGEKVKVEGRRRGSNCCTNWILSMTSLLGLSVVTLALSFVFLSSTQLEAISTLDYKGDFGEIFEMYPPLILYVASVWHFVILIGFCVWLGIIVFCPSSLSVGQCIVI